MKKFTKASGLVILTTVAKEGVEATVCASSRLTDTTTGGTFFDNLMVAAATDFSVATGNPSSYKSMSGLATALTDATHGLSTSVGSVLQNTLLAADLTGSSACGQCAYNFYKNVYSQMSESPNSICTVDTTTAAYTAMYYRNWDSIHPHASAAANSVADFRSMYCMAAVQGSIDIFNACANNGFDIRTGALSTICTADDFLNLDAQFNAYTVLMNHALQNSALPSDFTAAYTALSCRSCFDTFYSNIVANRAALTDISTGPCRDAASFGIYANGTGKCIDTSASIAPGNIVFGELLNVAVCSGIYNQLYIEMPTRPRATVQMLTNHAIRAYEATVECGVSVDPNVDDSHFAQWQTCLLNPAFGGSVALTLSPNDVPCYKALGHTANSLPSCSNAFSTSCLTALNLNTTVVAPQTHHQIDAPLMQYYLCAGFELNLIPTTCTVAEIATIPANHKTFVPVLEIVLAGNDEYSVVSDILNFTDLMAPLAGLQCSTCYPQLAAELYQTLSANEKVLCSSPYAAECKATASVTAALTRFKQCSGFSLTNDSANICSDAEWSVLMAADLPEETFHLAVPGTTYTLLEAIYKYENYIAVIKAANPLMQFRCDHCFEVLLNDLYVLQAASFEPCLANIDSADCYLAGAGSALITFHECSGHEMAFALPVITTTAAPETTTAAPATTTTAAPETTTAAPVTTTEAPTTTKTGSAMMINGALVAVVMAALML